MLYNVTKVYVLNNQVLYVDEGEISRDSKNFNQIDVITNVSGFGVEIAFKLPNGVFSDRIGLIQQTGTVTVPSDITELQNVAGEQWSVYTMLIDNAVLSAITSTTSQTLEFAVRFSNQITNLLVFDELADFPTTGEGDKVYQADNTKVFYIWNGTSYVTRTNQQADELIITEGQEYTTEPGFLSIQGTIGGEPVALDPAFYQNQIVSSFNNLVALYNAINNAITDTNTGLPAIAGKVSKSGDTMTGVFKTAQGTTNTPFQLEVRSDSKYFDKSLKDVKEVNNTTFDDGSKISDAIKFTNLNQLFAVSASQPGQGQTWIDTFAIALANKFNQFVTQAQLNTNFVRRDGTVPMTGNFNVGNNNIVNVNNINGTAFSSFVTNTNNHIGNTNNPHGVTKAQIDLENVTNDAQVKVSDRGVANGVATLDAHAKVPLNQLPDAAKQQTFVVTEFNELPTENVLEGDKGYVTSEGDSYIWDGSEWLVLAEADWENVNLDWANITNAPKSDADTTLANETIYTKTEADLLLDNKVDVEEGKGLSGEDFTTTLKEKLEGIEEDAQKNVQSNWDESDTNSDAFIQNKPTIVDPDDIGDRQYTEENVVTNGESITKSIDELDKEVDSLETNKMETDASNSDVLDLKFQNQDTEDALEVGELRLNKNLPEWQISANTLHLVGRQLIERAINRTGSQLAVGTPLFISGVFTPGGGPGTDRLEVELATRSNANGVFSVASCPSQNDVEGCIISRGTVRGWNTSNFTAGDKLYLTDTPGLYKVDPVGDGDVEFFVGTVVRAANDGIVYLNPIRIADGLFVPNTKVGGTEEGNIPIIGEDGLILPQYLGEAYSDVYVGYGVFDDPQSQTPKLLNLFPPDQWDVGEDEPIQDAEPFEKKTNTIYVTKNVTINTTYRYSVLAQEFVGLAPSPVGLGTTAGTAYPGDEGQTNRDSITNIVNGTTVVGKATADADGNVITTTYATKSELQGIEIGELNDIGDVEIVTPTDRQALLYNESEGEWQNKSLTTSDIDYALNDLTDVDVASAVQDDFLVFDGNKWENKAIDVSAAQTFTLTIATTDWVQATSGDWEENYLAVMTLNGLLDTDVPIVELDLSNEDRNSANNIIATFGKVFAWEVTDNDEITFYANSEPQEDIKIHILVVK